MLIYLIYTHRQFIYSIFVTKHLNLSFSIESESKDKISFLDVEAFRENARLKTIINHISNFSCVKNHFDSLLPSTSKFSVLRNLSFTCFKIFKYTVFHKELNHQKHFLTGRIYEVKQKLFAVEQETLPVVCQMLSNTKRKLIKYHLLLCSHVPATCFTITF